MSIDKLEYLYNKRVVLTNNDNYTHAIIMNTYMPELNIPKENVVSIAHEPNFWLFNFNNEYKNRYIEYATKHISRRFVGDKEDLPDTFIEGQSFLFYNKDHFYNTPKNKFCSIVVSNRNEGLNYNYRHDMLKAILKTDLPIDIYGRGTIYYNDVNDNRIKFPMDCTENNPFGIDPYIDYKFHICIENVISNNYFSEKIINPLLSNSIPIYYGCKTIDSYFNNIIKLSGDVSKDIEMLTHIYNTKDSYVNNNKYSTVLDKNNVFNNLHILFDNIKLKPKLDIKIFIIHYEKLHERKEFIIKQLEREQITDYEFITIDRDELTKADIAPFENGFSKPLIANFLSHIYAYNQIKTNNYNYNLILEDDAILCKNFYGKLQLYLEQLPYDYDAVFIGDGCDIDEHHINILDQKENTNIYNYNGKYKCKCTDSYLISSKCANKIIENFDSCKKNINKINEPIDYFLNNVFELLNVFWCEPTLVKQGTIIGLFPSSVNNAMQHFDSGLNPKLLTCYKSPFSKIRVGKDYDGGYVICNIQNIEYNLLLSCGISDDISFEEEFCKMYKNSICYAYDGTIESINIINTNITFYKQNINNFNDDHNTNLHSVIDRFDNIFLKMDIEGYEITWIKTLSDEQLNKISQIVIEFHFPFNNDEKEVFLKLNKTFCLVHFHANNCCGVRNHNNVIIPNVFECTYLNRKYFNNYYELNQDNIPSKLDMKNVLDKDEIIIDYEPFVTKF